MRKCDFCFLFERSWHACWFSTVIVSGRRDLPSNARTFIAAEKPHQSSARLTLYLKIRRPIYKRLFKSNRVLRADQKSVLNQTCSLHQDLMHRGCRGTTVPNVCLQALTLSLLSPRDFFTLSPNKEPVYRLKFILIWPHFLRLVKFVSLASSRFIHGRFHTYNGWALFPKCKLKCMCLPLKQFLLVAIPWMPLSKNRIITCQI